VVEHRRALKVGEEGANGTETPPGVAPWEGPAPAVGSRAGGCIGLRFIWGDGSPRVPRGRPPRGPNVRRKLSKRGRQEFDRTVQEAPEAPAMLANGRMP
jgi:hypothetical protein